MYERDPRDCCALTGIVSDIHNAQTYKTLTAEIYIWFIETDFDFVVGTLSNGQEYKLKLKAVVKAWFSRQNYTGIYIRIIWNHILFWKTNTFSFYINTTPIKWHSL
jgi:hypothetical protein